MRDRGMYPEEMGVVMTLYSSLEPTVLGQLQKLT